MSINEQGDSQVLTEDSTEVREPKQFKVILLNDDYTSMDFVVAVLETIFGKTPAEATRIMLDVHNRGSGVCGIYPKEIAEAKVALVHARAREAEYPLKCRMEEV